MAFKREFNPWGFLPLDLFQLHNITRKLWLPALLELRPLICLLQPILLGSLHPPTHIPPATYPSGLPTPPSPTHIPPAAYPSGLPTPPSLTSLLQPILLGSLPPSPTHIPPAAYPSGLPNPPPQLISLLLPILLSSLTPVLSCL